MGKSNYLSARIVMAIMMFGISSIGSAELLYKYVNNGFSAYFSGGDNIIPIEENPDSPLTPYVYAHVIQNGLGNDKSTSLYYHIVIGQEIRSWSGIIPNSAVTSVGPGKFSVNYNTCEVDQTPSCGVFNVTWKMNKVYSSHSSGLTKIKVQDIIMQTNGVRTENSANTEGTLADIDLSTIKGLHGSIGVGHNVTHTVTKGIK